MKNAFAYTRYERVLLFLFYAALAMGCMASISSGTTHPLILDYINHVASIVQAKLAFAEGQFPLRVAPYSLSGWRYPLYQFYSPSVYMFAGLVYQCLTPANPMAAYELTLWTFIILGGVYMNRLAYWLVKSRQAALLASVVYLASPYYLIVINHLAGFSEAVALGIMPATLYYTLQCYSHPAETKSLLQAALAWYLLATAHLVTFVYTSIFVALLLLLITLKNYKYWLNLINAGIAYIFGCLLAIWYFAPIALLGKYLRMNERYINAFAQFRVTLANLLAPARNILNIAPDPVTGYIKTTAQVHPNIGIPMLLAFGVCCYVIFAKSKSENARADYWISPLFIIFLLSILMAWSPVNVWPWLPRVLTIGQYSWRVMSQTIWIGSLLFAWVISWLFKNKLNEWQLVSGIFLILIATGIWISVPERTAARFDPAEFKRNPTAATDRDSYIIDARKNPQFVHFANAVALAKPYCKQQKDTTVCSFTPPATTGLVALPVFYYPDLLSVSINGKPAAYTSALTQNGIVAAVKPLPGVLNTIKVQFRGLAWANALSAMTWGLWFLILLFLKARSVTARFQSVAEKG